MTTAYTALSLPAAVRRFVDAGLVSGEAAVTANLVMSSFGVDAGQDPWMCFVTAVVLTNPGTGNSCVTLDDLVDWLKAASEKHGDAEGHAPATVDPVSTFPDWPSTADQWRSIITGRPELVATHPGDGSMPPVPLVIEGDLVYSSKSYAEEVFVAGRLVQMLLEGRLHVVTGGPGSGKTSSIARRIVERLSDPALADESIALAAPTGLAAKRMKFALSNALSNPHLGIEVTDEVAHRINELPKSTVHRLLRFNPSARRQWGRHAGKKLTHKVVILDEVSMMPLSMMARVLDALAEDAILYLVGDKDQLASVDSGSVLADICRASDSGPRFVEPMRGTFRFPADSPVARLSAAINSGNIAALDAVIDSGVQPTGEGDRSTLFDWVDPESDQKGLSSIARAAVQHARQICERAAAAVSDDDLQQLLDFRESFQVVCAHRRGNLGVSGWNSTIDRRLGDLAKGQWYVGRPVIVLTNDYVNDLSNGDIGVVWEDEENNRCAVFAGNEGIRRIPVSKLPPVATVHALTIHKSQGSEYGHTVVVLPIKTSQIVTRELVYTGITRAKPRLTLVSTRGVLHHAAATPIRRATGLADRLFSLLSSAKDRWPFVEVAE